MNAMAGVAISAAGLLAVTGVVKLARPAAATGALYAVGFPVPPWAVRSGALLEVGSALAALALGGAIAWSIVGSCYAGFTAFLVMALRSPQRVVSCGCTGAADTPPTRSHLVLTVLSAVAAAAAAAGDTGGLPGTWRANTVPQTVTMLLFAAVVGWLGWLVLTALPRVRW